MMIYRLLADTSEYPVLHQVTEAQSISMAALRQKWHPFPEPLPRVDLALYRSDSGKKNYKTDVSTADAPFLVFSESFAECFRDVLMVRGQFLPVTCPSTKKKFTGFYPTNPIYGCIDLSLSTYEQYPLGKVFRHYVLVGNRITDDWLFSAEEGGAVFVTEKFRTLVEEKGFQGFSWRHQVEVV